MSAKATTRKQPAKFDRCVKKVKRKGGAKNAYAVCAAAGTRNPGKGEWKVFYKVQGKWEEQGTYNDKEYATFYAKRDADGRQWKLQRVKSNPASASAQVFEEFHGYKPTETVKVTKQRHHHKHLAAAGDLVGLMVISLKDEERKIEGLGDAILAFNEAKNQLFIQGGDQRMTWAELKKFGATEEHELQTLGQLKAIGYFTNKTHLGSEGGEAIYSHKFRTTNEWGRHITVKIARYPDLIYRVLDEQFEISGGSYTILREGIDK